MTTNSTFDYYNHKNVAPGTTFTAAATGTTVAGTVVPVAAGAGTGSSTAIIAGSSPNDSRGQFNLVTAGTPAAGKVASLYFTNPYSQLPGAVNVTATDNTASPVAPVAVSPVVTATGIDFYAGGLTTAHTVTINYNVIP